MRKNVIETVMGAVVLVVAVSFVITAFQSTSAGKIDGYRIYADFDDASGLTPGTDVRLAGVKIGTVTSQQIDTETFFAGVEMNIDERIRLPLDTSARVIPDGLLGGNYIALEPGAEEETIGDGEAIEYSQGAINVVDLLGRFIFSSADQAGGGQGEEP